MGNSLGLWPWLPSPLSEFAILNISLCQYPKGFTDDHKPIIWGTLCKNPGVGLGIWALLPACLAEEMQGALFRPCSVIWAWGWLSLEEGHLCHLQKLYCLASGPWLHTVSCLENQSQDKNLNT